MEKREREQGGRRRYSGRPEIPKEDRRVPISAMVTPDTKRKIKQLSEELGQSIGKTIDGLLDYAGEG